MNYCKEFVLDDVKAVSVIPLEDYNTGAVSWQLSALIDADLFSPVLLNAITIGIQPAEPGGILIPIRKGTGSVKDEEQDAVAGRLHTVKVSCEVDDRDFTIWESLLLLERTPGHLLMTLADGTQVFAAATGDTYQCTVQRDGAKTTVSLRVQCVMGLQPIVVS